MSHVFIAPYVGTGRLDDDFRPRGSEQPGWAAIDIRPDSTILTGLALMSVPVRDNTIGTYLGDDPDAVVGAVRAGVQSRLGLTLRGARLRDIIPELLIEHAREDGTRWRPVRAMRDGMLRIYLGGLFWEQRPIRGGSTITESFNTADSDTLGPDLSWTETVGDWDVVSNQAKQMTVSAATSHARANSDLATDDHYAQIVCATLTRGTSSSARIGPICRKDATATDTFYACESILTAAVNEHRMYKFVGGTSTQLGASDPTDFVAGEVLRIEADGSSITTKLNGGTLIGPITDTAITGNLRAGIRGTHGDGSGVCIADSFEAGDLAAAGVIYPQLERLSRGIERGILIGAR